MEKVITNADDFGYSADTVRATIECFERGALTSATIMANMPATQEAVRYAAAHPELSFGAHLTFVGGDGGERPLLEAGQIPHLVDAQGGFLTPEHITHVVAYLLDPQSPVNRK